MCHGDMGGHGGGESDYQEDMGMGREDKGRDMEEVKGVEVCHGGHEEDMGPGDGPPGHGDKGRNTEEVMGVETCRGDMGRW